jgi:hypothetical protein
MFSSRQRSEQIAVLLLIHDDFQEAGPVWVRLLVTLATCVSRCNLKTWIGRSAVDPSIRFAAQLGTKKRALKKLQILNSAMTYPKGHGVPSAKTPTSPDPAIPAPY